MDDLTLKEAKWTKRETPEENWQRLNELLENAFGQPTAGNGTDESQKDKSVAASGGDLISAWVQSLKNLRAAGIIRSYNNPIADIAESAVAKGLHLKLADNSINPGHDAVDPTTDARYQIKARRFSDGGYTTRVSIADKSGRMDYDKLVVVLVNDDGSLRKSVVISKSELPQNKKKLQIGTAIKLGQDITALVSSAWPLR
jgi:hypothetical protein